MNKQDKTILVVDDDSTVQQSLRRTLESAGYTVHTADSGPDALSLLEKLPVQLMISDHDMPGMNGVELFMHVRNRHPDICRIMITGQTDRQVLLRSINEGEVYRFIEKPWDNSVLRVMVHFAFESLELMKENRRLLDVVRRQVALSREAERTFPGLAEPDAGNDASAAGPPAPGANRKR